MSQHNRFTLNKRSNPCPICNSDDGRCKESADGIQLCMGVLTKQVVPGFEFRGTTKNNVWGLWVQAQNFASPAEKNAWQVELERKKLQRHLTEQREREAALSAEERHSGYISVFSQLRLEDCDRNELLNRGFTDAQIAKVGFRSVGQWQKLSGLVNPKLPGASPEGDRLNIPYPGYLCFAHDAEGRICGAQVRSRNNEGPRYYWLTSRSRKNTSGLTPHMPSGELPLSVYWPSEISSRQIAFVEGIGPKPALAAKRLGCPVIGAAGAQWSSSPSELKNALATILERLEGAVEYVLYPDGGMLDARHEAVRDRYRDLVNCLGVDLRVAWWGQKAYGQDIDEISSSTSIALISWSEFEAMADSDGEIPEELLLELQVKDYASERDIFRKVLKGNQVSSAFKVSGRRLDRLAEYAANAGKKEGLDINEIAADMFDEIELRASGKGLPGVNSGYYDYDTMTQGFQPSEMIIVAGRPAQGKTSFILNCALNIACDRKPVAIFSLEMSKTQLSYRLLSALASIETGRLRTGRIGQHEWEPLGHHTAHLSQLPIWIDDDPTITVSDIRDKLSRREEKPSIIFIDYLQLIGGPEDSAVARVSNISRELKILSRELEVPVVALSQLSRAVESRTNKRPVMSDLRESGAIEQDADLITMLYREEYYNPDTPDRGLAELIIVKHRNGPTGTVKLLFEQQFTRFRILAPSFG